MNRASEAPPVLSRFNPAQPGAAGMKAAATGLLVVMAGVFFAARALEPSYPWLSYVKAFAEAAMVGGLADWFADKEPEARISLDEKIRSREIASEVQTVLGSLKPKYRLPLLLKYVEGLSYQEIAVVLDIPAGTVKSRLRRGREQLRETVERLAGQGDLAARTLHGLETWARGVRERAFGEG